MELVNTSANSTDAPKVMKYDADKPNMALLDSDWLEGVARVMTFGAKKYKANLWREGMSWSRVISSAMRHLNAINKREDLDPETGLPHAQHLSCCAMFLDWYLTNRPAFDDRYKEKKD